MTDVPAGAPGGPRPERAAHDPRARRRAALVRRHHQVDLADPRREARRVGLHAGGRTAATPLRLVAGRLRDGLHLLPDRHDGARPQPRGPARSWTRSTGRTAGSSSSGWRRGRARSRTSSSWGWASRSRTTGTSSSPSTSSSSEDGPQLLAPPRHGLDVRPRPAHAPARRGDAGEARGLAQRDDRRAARRAHADQPALAARRAAGGLPRRSRSGTGAGSPSSTCSSGGVNDALEDARRLADLVRGIPAKVNLIPYNDEPGARPTSRRRRSGSSPSGRARRPRNLTVVVRKNRGRDISAACGQLAAEGGPGRSRDRGRRTRRSDAGRASTGRPLAASHPPYASTAAATGACYEPTRAAAPRGRKAQGCPSSSSAPSRSTRSRPPSGAARTSSAAPRPTSRRLRQLLRPDPDGRGGRRGLPRGARPLLRLARGSTSPGWSGSRAGPSAGRAATSSTSTPRTRSTPSSTSSPTSGPSCRPPTATPSTCSSATSIPTCSARCSTRCARRASSPATR